MRFFFLISQNRVITLVHVHENLLDFHFHRFHHFLSCITIIRSISISAGEYRPNHRTIFFFPRCRKRKKLARNSTSQVQKLAIVRTAHTRDKFDATIGSWLPLSSFQFPMKMSLCLYFLAIFVSPEIIPRRIMICDQLTRDASSMTFADFDEIQLGNWLLCAS